MKIESSPWIIISLLALGVFTARAQEVYVNPASVTLTQQGLVSVIVTDNASTTKVDTVTVGSIQAVYYNGISGWASNQGPNVIAASGVASGTLDAGTYPVTVTGGPKQTTVILWNENTGKAFALSDIELAYGSASSTDQAAFRVFIAGLIQDQLTALQNQIDSQQAQLTALQQSDSQQSSAIAALQTSLANLQSKYDQLADQLITSLSQLSDRIDAHDKTLATLAAEIADLQKKLASLPTNSSTKSNDDLAKAGTGLGAAGLASLFGYLLADADSTPSQGRSAQSSENSSRMTTSALPARLQSSKAIYPHQP